MPVIDFLGPEFLQSIAQQLSTWLPDFLDETNSPSTTFSIGESIPLKYMNYEDTQDQEKKDSDCIHDPGIWHVQIFQDMKPKYFARVSLRDNGDVYVRSFHESFLALFIEERLEFIERTVTDNSAKVTLLEIPSFLITLLLIEDSFQISFVVASRPEEIDLVLNDRYGFNQIRSLLINKPPLYGLIENQL